MSFARSGFDSSIGAFSFTQVLSGLLDGVARMLDVPIALLSRDQDGWRFEAEAFPPKPVADAPQFRGDAPVAPMVAGGEVVDAAGSPWTGLAAGKSKHREWLLMLPGRADRWVDVPGLDTVIGSFGRSLEAVVQLDDERRHAQRYRRLYAFARRLSRSGEAAEMHKAILSAMAREVGAQTASFALFNETDHALMITATLGYALATVEHLRIAPGQGVIGHAYATQRAVAGTAALDAPRRLRYKTDSYMVIPLLAAGKPVAVVCLTDRGDGLRFDDRDLAGARLVAAPAALALARQQLADHLEDLTRAATVDPVTGLFNRRYFETRIQAEVQRARRQQHDLALLMVDVDDFKRINDTFGHLEGDRALRDVADLLRRGVRIFDVCARFGGEEFAIVMPGATRQMAEQVAERIRRGMADRSRMTTMPLTVSVGVGILGADESEEDLIGAADRALISAKRAGKNVVKIS